MKSTETAKEALERYNTVIEKLIDASPNQKEYIEEQYKLVLSDKWKMSLTDIALEEESLNLKFPNDILRFKQEIGNFKLGIPDDDNHFVFGLIPLIECWDLELPSNLEEEYNFHKDISNKEVHERLARYIVFFGKSDSMDTTQYCLDTATQNPKTKEMKIEPFDQDRWIDFANNEIDECSDNFVFDQFMSEFVDDSLYWIKKEFFKWY